MIAGVCDTAGGKLDRAEGVYSQVPPFGEKQT